MPTAPKFTASTVGRTHPKQSRWLKDEQRMRASYIASRRELAPFLVPHRFEGNEKPEQLRRAGYGYGVGLNKSYLAEILGHVQSTDVAYQWDTLTTGEDEQDGTPKDGLARTLYTDATRKGVKLRDFFEGEVLEWMCSSPGGFVIVDTPERDASITSAADEKAAGVRPYFRFVPFSAVEDMRPGPTGFTWVKFIEEVDTRSPDQDNAGVTIHRLLYRLEDDGSTTLARMDGEGKMVDRAGNPTGAPISLGKIVNTEGTPILPLVPVIIGEHPEVPFVGTGLLYGLDDIVIDLFNVTSEMREAYRDAAFGMWVHSGPDGEKVNEQFTKGTRLTLLGDGDNASLELKAGNTAEVEAGLKLIEFGVKNWALSAKRQAAEAMQKSGAKNTSGVSLQAEFALDLKPLLVSVCVKLDSIQTNALYIAAQMASENVAADKLGVVRNTEFQLEDEASRIARIAKDYVLALPLTAEMKVQLAMAWVESLTNIDLNAEVEVPEMPSAEEIAQRKADQANAEAEAAKSATAEPNADGTPADPSVVGAIKPAEPAAPRKIVKMTVRDRILQELRAMTDAEQANNVAQLNSGPVTDPVGGMPALGVRRVAPPVPPNDDNA